jgi:hypothetical protein
MDNWNLCKCCYINKTKTDFCTSCVEVDQEVIGKVKFTAPQIISADYSEMVKETVEKLDRSILG